MGFRYSCTLLWYRNIRRPRQQPEYGLLTRQVPNLSTSSHSILLRNTRVSQPIYMTWCDLGNPFNELLRRGFASVDFDSAPYPPPSEAFFHVGLLFTYNVDSRITAIVPTSLTITNSKQNPPPSISELREKPPRRLDVQPLFSSVVPTPTYDVYAIRGNLPLGIYTIQDPFPYTPDRFTTNGISVDELDVALSIYSTQGTPSALLIPGSPVTHRCLQNGADKFPKISRGYFAAHPQDSIICLVTDTYVTRKVAFDYRQHSLDCHYVVNTREGHIPEQFTIRHNSPSLIELRGECAFLERHLKITRFKLSQALKSFWKTMVGYLPF